MVKTQNLKHEHALIKSHIQSFTLQMLIFQWVNFLRYRKQMLCFYNTLSYEEAYWSSYFKENSRKLFRQSHSFIFHYKRVGFSLISCWISSPILTITTSDKPHLQQVITDEPDHMRERLEKSCSKSKNSFRYYSNIFHL